MFDLSGKVAVVTGCNTGLGQGMALALAQAGCDIVGLNIVPADETAAAAKKIGRRFHDIATDLSKAKAEDLIARATAAFGRIDILVNNAGIIRRADALEFSERDWDDVIAVNLKAVFFLAQAAARQLIRQQTAGQSKGGRIINTASLLSFQGGIRVPSYTAAKSGVLGLTRLLANEWAQYGITVSRPLHREGGQSNSSPASAAGTTTLPFASGCGALGGHVNICPGNTHCPWSARLSTATRSSSGSPESSQNSLHISMSRSTSSAASSVPSRCPSLKARLPSVRTILSARYHSPSTASEIRSIACNGVSCSITDSASCFSMSPIVSTE